MCLRKNAFIQEAWEWLSWDAGSGEITAGGGSEVLKVGVM